MTDSLAPMRRLCLLAVVVLAACSTAPSATAERSVVTPPIDGAAPELPGAAPSSDGPPPAGDAGLGPSPSVAPAPAATSGEPEPPTGTRSPLADLVTPVGTATYDPDEHVEPVRPVAISIPRLGVDRAPIEPVGVTESGELDVPDPLVVGWYRGSPAPGTEGASVLAAHVNFDGVPGVFRYLRDLEGGELLAIESEDGGSQVFVVTEVQLYDKDELPEERVWAKDGDPTLVLFTCGGRYNRAQRSYEDNVVAYAIPFDAG